MSLNPISTVKISILAVSLVCAMVTIASGQPQNMTPIEKAKMYPPSILSSEDNETNLLSISWQLERQKALYADCRKGRAEVDDQISAYSSEVDALNKMLPADVRLMDSNVRSQLIGKVLEQLMMAKLASLKRAFRKFDQNWMSPRLTITSLRSWLLKRSRKLRSLNLKKQRSLYLLGKNPIPNYGWQNIRLRSVSLK